MVQESICQFSDLPPWLSCFREKLQLYARDPFFCAAWSDLLETTGSDEERRSLLWKSGTLLFKADSTLAGATARGLAALDAAGYAIDFAVAVNFDSAKVRGLWEHSLGRYSPQRAKVLERLMSLAPSLYLIVTPPPGDDPYPASVRLTAFKGQAEPDERRPGQLRYQMGEPRSAILNLVHTADEPADVVRELGLLLDRSDRRAALAALGRGPAAAAASGIAASVASAPPPVDLGFAGTLARLRDAIAQLEADDRRQASLLLDRISEMADADRAWRLFQQLITTKDAALSEIDRLVLDAHLAPLKRPVKRQPFPTVEERHWAAYLPTL